MLGKKERRKEKRSKANVDKFDHLVSEGDDSCNKLKCGGMEGTIQITERSQSETQSKIENAAGSQEADIEMNIRTSKSKKAGKKKKKDRLSKKGCKLMEKGSETVGNGVYHIFSGDKDCSKGMKSGGMEGTIQVTERSQSKTQSKIENAAGSQEADIEMNIRTSKSKKAGKKKKKDRLSKKGSKLMEKGSETVGNGVYHISSGDEDCSKGMKKWITEYHQSRPALKILQERIDEFITAHEAQEEQARKEREARAAEGGWTVVVHHKGRKKTTDSESGITVGSVAQAAVVDKMAKKKSKDVGLDFYRFQRREAQRNEVMMLQSKFEQDRKRIQQLRAARKFRPY